MFLERDEEWYVFLKKTKETALQYCILKRPFPALVSAMPPLAFMYTIFWRPWIILASVVWPYLDCEIQHKSGVRLHWFKGKEEQFCCQCLKCLVNKASLNWKKAFMGFKRLSFLHVTLEKLIFMYCIGRIFGISWAFRWSQCFKSIYRFRIMTWYCVVEFALFSCIPLCFLFQPYTEKLFRHWLHFASDIVPQ